MIFEQFHTFLAKDVRLEGGVQSGEDVLIGGVLEGRVRCKKSVHLLESAKVSNLLEAESCTLYGATVSGTIKIHDRLKIYRNSNITGTITAKVLDVEAGAVVNATIKMDTEDGRSTRKARATKAET